MFAGSVSVDIGGNEVVLVAVVGVVHQDCPWPPTATEVGTPKALMQTQKPQSQRYHEGRAHEKSEASLPCVQLCNRRRECYFRSSHVRESS